MAIAFQFRDKSNNSVNLPSLDDQLATHFGMTVNPKKWTLINGWDWFNNLGYCIAAKCSGKTPWGRVKKLMIWWTLYGETKKEHRDEAKKLLRETILPVCDYIESLGLSAYGCGYVR